jgi:hypothetical protein
MTWDQWKEEKTRNEPDYVKIAWIWLSDQLLDLMTDQWYPRVGDDSKNRFVMVGGTLVDRTGESRTFSVFIMRDGTVRSERSYVRPKLLTIR